MRKFVIPESDGQPTADNSKQFRWIVTIQGGLDSLFQNEPNVFVAGDLLWYPVEGDNKTWIAPDAMVVFGRLKGDRGSYQQWQENNIPPQVVFEVLSPGNRQLGVRFELAAVGLEIYRPDGQKFATYVELDQQRKQAIARANQETQRADRLAAKLQELGIDLDTL